MTEAERSLHPLFCRRHYCRIAKLIEGLAIARDDPEFIADQFCEMSLPIIRGSTPGGS